MSGPPRHVLKLLGELQTASIVHAIGFASKHHFSRSMPITATKLAEKNGHDSEVTFRVLRCLQAQGYFKQKDQKENNEVIWENNANSQLLDYDVFGATIQHFCQQSIPCWSAIEKTVESGNPNFSQTIGNGNEFFDFVAKNPQQDDIFNKCMTQLSGDNSPISQSYAWGKHKVICDVGGGYGHLISNILTNVATNTKGIIFDLDTVLSKAASQIKTYDLNDRLEAQPGSFFEASTIPQADCYILKHILHDWNDSECVGILKNIAEANKTTPEFKITVIEHVFHDGPDPVPGIGTFLDLQMAVLVTGKERTKQQWEGLFKQAGFTAESWLPIPELHPTLQCITLSLGEAKKTI